MVAQDWRKTDAYNEMEKRLVAFVIVLITLYYKFIINSSKIRNSLHADEICK